MFRVKESEEPQGFSLADRVIQATMLLAVIVNCVSACFIVWGVGLPLESVLVVSALLLFGLAATWWSQRQYQASQKSLRRVKMLAHDILASMDQGVVTTDREGLITSINSAALRLLQGDVACVGQCLTSISPSDIPLIEVYREVIGNQSTIRDRDFKIDRAGRVLRARVDGHVLTDAEGTSLGCVIHIRDLTERILMEQRMHRLERFLSLATLASGLHHEIKNPLTALSIHIQLLEEGLARGQDAEAVDELVGVLKTEVHRLNGVLESFRSFANLQHMTIQPTNVFQVLDNAIRLIRPQAAEQGVEIVPPGLDKKLPLVPLDTEKFEQAVLNLIINALEAMPEGGVLTVGACVREDKLEVSVQDSGPGIPPEIRTNLFQPYFSTKDRGSGMGLALSEKLISQHGGQIGFRTGPDGTTFDITIPMKRGNGNA